MQVCVFTHLKFKSILGIDSAKRFLPPVFISLFQRLPACPSPPKRKEAPGHPFSPALNRSHSLPARRKGPWACLQDILVRACHRQEKAGKYWHLDCPHNTVNPEAVCFNLVLLCRDTEPGTCPGPATALHPLKVQKKTRLPLHPKSREPNPRASATQAGQSVPISSPTSRQSQHLFLPVQISNINPVEQAAQPRLPHRSPSEQQVPREHCL